jgi:hypothetical protein
MELAGSLQDELDLGLRHRLADVPMDDAPTETVEHRAEVVERAGDVEVRDVDVPVLVCTGRLDEAGTLQRRFRIPTVEATSAPRDAIRRRRRNERHVLVDHHERQAPVAFERELVVERDDGRLLLLGHPVVARDMAVVLVDLAVALLPVEEFPARDVEPGDEPVYGFSRKKRSRSMDVEK